MALQSPAVREHGQERRYRELSHTSVEVCAHLISLLTFLFFSALAPAHTVGLSWDARTFPNVVGYNIYRGPSANGPYTKINSSLDPNTTYSDTTLQAGETYYYVTTAVDNQGVERAYPTSPRPRFRVAARVQTRVVQFCGRSERMKRLFTICMILSSCLNLGFAQGIRGSVKLTGRAAIVTTGHAVTLSWNATQGATVIASTAELRMAAHT